MHDSEQEIATDGAALFTSIYTPYMQEHLSGRDLAVLQELIDQGIEFHKATERQVVDLFP